MADPALPGCPSLLIERAAKKTTGNECIRYYSGVVSILCLCLTSTECAFALSVALAALYIIADLDLEHAHAYDRTPIFPS